MTARGHAIFILLREILCKHAFKLTITSIKDLKEKKKSNGNNTCVKR